MTRKTPFGGRSLSARCSTLASTMRVRDSEAKKAAKLQGGITQQSAEDTTFRQSGVDVESARSVGFIPPVNSARPS
jgi:hypothetical protein